MRNQKNQQVGLPPNWCAYACSSKCASSVICPALILALLVVGLCLAPPCQAGAMYGAGYEGSSTSFPFPGDGTQNSPTPVEFTVSGSSMVPGAASSDLSFSALGNAQHGFLGANGRVDMILTSGPFFRSESLDAEGFSSFTIDDVVITGGVSGSHVSASFNLQLNGTLSASGSGNDFAASANVTIGGNVAGVGFPGSMSILQSSGGQSSDSSGILNGFSLGSPLPAVQFSAQVDVPFGIFMFLHTDAGGHVSEQGGDAEAISDFSHTFGFPTSGPVFNLPDGFTANSPEGQIANNNFVPEPSTLALAAIGLGLVACYRRRTARP